MAPINMQQQMAYMRQQMAQMKQGQTEQRAISPERSQPMVVDDRQFQMPQGFFNGGLNAQGQYDPLALTPEETRLLGGYSHSAFDGMNSALGITSGQGFNAHTTAADVFGANYEQEFGLTGISASPFDPNYKSTSELWMEGLATSGRPEDQDFMRDLNLLTAPASASVSPSFATERPENTNNPSRLDELEIKRMFLQAHFNALAQQKMQQQAG